jgi:hypothetical protein
MSDSVNGNAVIEFYDVSVMPSRKEVTQMIKQV